MIGLYFLCCLLWGSTWGDQSDVGLNPAQMIANHGYPSETHTVTTPDGYMVTLFRIPTNTTRPPVFLMHGFGACSAEFVALGPKRGLAYILADAGYDVWLGNARGTTFSRNHTSINVDTNPKSYFNFTWHEIGYYDVATAIDYILEQNGAADLHYIGHSQGTTTLLVLLSTRPEYNQKVRLASLMAPAAIVEHYPNMFIQELCMYIEEVWGLLQRYRIFEIPLVGQIRESIVNICRSYPNGTKNAICDLIHATVLHNVDADMVPVVVTNCPSSAGIKQYVHYGQLVKHGGFRQFDHGKEANLVIYGSETPPDYDLSRITSPIAFYYAENDGLITVEDEKSLVAMLPNVAVNYLVPDADFEHIDFAMSNQVVELVYNKLLSVMSKY